MQRSTPPTVDNEGIRELPVFEICHIRRQFRHADINTGDPPDSVGRVVDWETHRRDRTWMGGGSVYSLSCAFRHKLQFNNLAIIWYLSAVMVSFTYIVTHVTTGRGVIYLCTDSCYNSARCHLPMY